MGRQKTLCVRQVVSENSQMGEERVGEKQVDPYLLLGTERGTLNEEENLESCL